MRHLRAAFVVLCCVAACNAQSKAPAKASSKSAGAGSTTSLPPKIPAFDLSAMDRSIDPCTDFYRYACGGWMAQNPIPPDQASWARFHELQERNREVLHQILERAAKPDPKRSPVMQKIGDFYSSCMDEQKIDALGAKALEPALERIAKIASRRDLLSAIAYLQSAGVDALFRFGPTPDFHNAGMTIASVDQGGLGLPDRDYYFKEDAKSVETREKYAAHVQKMFELLGDKPPSAAAEAKTVMEIETGLAEASMDRTARRNPANRDHPMTPQELEQFVPGLEFKLFFTAAAAPEFEKVNVGNPGFFQQVNKLLDSMPLDDWKTYLRWHLLRATAAWLSQPFAEENFRFYRTYLAGQKEQQARWKRCVRLTDAEMGEALGQPYVEETFGAEGKQRTLKMVEGLEKALGEDLRSLPWMTAETKAQAEVKLAGISNKIGYPDQWRDYSRLRIVRGDFMGNLLRSESFEFDRQVHKIGQPVDKREWGMSPPTVNAYYSPLQNNINFPAGILQPPFYDNRMDDAVNFGGIGTVIGHELTHGFDDQGSKYDARGNLRNWWTPADKTEFEKRTACIADEYSQFVAVDDVHVNGKLTLGENTADNGGVRIALMALRDVLAGKPAPRIDGFTPEQRFFIAYGQIWCQNQSPESARLQALTNPHSPGRYRANGVVSNMPEFQKAFGCKEGSPMVRENACRVW
jgi:putative endopeptidase